MGTVCPWPERYSFRDVKATEWEVIELVAGFIRALQPNYVIETGTYKGDMSAAIGEALQANGHGWLDTLEINQALASEATARLKGLPVTVHLCDSTKFVPREPPQFVWFDSSFDARKAEFHSWYANDWLNPGTILGFHDTDDRFGVAEFVEHLEEAKIISAIFLPTHRGAAFAEVLDNA